MNYHFCFILNKNSEFKLGLYRKHSTRYIYIIIGKVLRFCSQYIVNTYIQYSIQFCIGTEAHHIGMCLLIYLISLWIYTNIKVGEIPLTRKPIDKC